MSSQYSQEKGILLTEVESKELLQKAGIPVVETRLARNKAQAIAFSQAMGFPVALKIISPDISHKTDVGGVKLNLTGPSLVSRAYTDILSSVNQKQPSARVEGVSVRKWPVGVELIIGVSQDAQFGPVLMFGLGGILVEVLKDVSFRIIPLTRRDASEMVREIKGFALLTGFRGQEPVDIPSVEDLILRVSDLVEKNPHIKELDLNPLFGYHDGVLVVDARIVIDQ